MIERKKKTCKRAPKRFEKKIRENTWFARFSRAYLSEYCVRAKKILKKIRENAWFAVVGKCTCTHSSFS